MGVGIANTTITPDYPVFMDGFGSRTEPSEGAFSGLEASAVVFWDLRGMTNADALEKLRQDATAARLYLEKMDFTTRAIKTLDVARRRSEINRLAQSCRGEQEFSAIFDPLFLRLEDVQSRLRKQKQADDVVDPAAERELTELLDKLTAAEWDLKFHALTHN